MPYNPTIQTTHYYVDVPNKMMLIQNHSWNPNGNGNMGDALGRSLIGWFLYDDPQFIEGAKNCWKRIECDPDTEDCTKWDYYYKGHRYPTPEYFLKDFSRDHTSNTMVLMALSGEDEWLKELTSHIRYTITKKHRNSKGKVYTHRFTPAMWGWAKAFAGKWWGKPLYYSITFFEKILYTIINNLCYLLGWIGPEVHQNDYDKLTMQRQKQSKWTQFWAGLTYPVYALSHAAWKSYLSEVTETSKFWRVMNRILQLMSYPLIGKHHYLFKLMFNVGKVTKEDVLGYKSMKGGRWSTPLNVINDRDVFIIKNPEWLEANVLDVDLLKTFWNIRHPEDKIIID